MKKYCNHCKKYVVCKNLGGHKSTCKYNPNNTLKYLVHNTKKLYKLKCRKCSKGYNLKITEYSYNRGNYRKHCSQSCANIRVQTPEQNEARREKLSGETKKPIKCKECNKVFIPDRDGRKFCSQRCAGNYSIKIPGMIQKLSGLAKQRGSGGHVSRNIIYFNKGNGERIKLQSNYELRVALELDNNKVNWIRPKSLIWNDSKGDLHRYYPDFYLPDYDVYLDPKNEYLIKKDKIKIAKVSEQNKVRVIVLGVEQLEWNKIKLLLWSNG